MILGNDLKNTLTQYLKDTSVKDKHDLGFDKHSLSEDQKKLINQLVSKHGGGEIFRSKSGLLELRIATPHLLEEDGEKELQSRHLYVNVDKVINDGHNMAARCVKDGKAYDVRTLLAMLPIEERALNIKPSSVKRRVRVFDQMKYMERDEMGNLIPPGPGEITPVIDLEEDHPALEYILGRGFDPRKLYEQFGASYCYKENPNMFYKKLSGGFRGTPQGRIVFYINQLGVNRGWQARQLDRRVGDDFQIFHPYVNEWVTIAKYHGNELEVLSNFNGKHVGKAPNVILKQKYIIGMGVEKNMTLMGFDAAREHEGTENTIGLVEGVLDAARLGPPFCSLMGLRLSTNQASLIRNHFSRVVFITDNDNDRENALIMRDSINRALNPFSIEAQELQLPVNVKDAGDLTEEQAKAIKEKI